MGLHPAIVYTQTEINGTQVSGTFTIVIYDDNGNLTNGNNIQVAYRATVNGTVYPILYATIAGQSKKIYSGLVSSSGITNVSYAIVSYTPGTASPPIAPDLAINSIDIIQKADSSGNNGIVNINASSSNQPIAYYIDNVLQTGSQNLTVTSGIHTAKVTDPTGAEVDQQFTVLQVNNLLTYDPSFTANGKTSKWNAAFNPIVFTYQRRDFQVLNITQDATTLCPAILLNTDLTGLSIGDYVYVNAGLTNGESVYQGAYQVLAILNTNTVVINTTYVAPTTIEGYCNSDDLRPYYKVITLINYIDPYTGLFTQITSTNRPNTSGVTRADISNFIQTILKPQPDQSNYTAINYRDYGLGVSYTISFAEAWEGSTPVYSTVSNPYYATFTAKQLQQNGGGNMFDYVTQPNGVQLANWLIDFVEPLYTPGYPFDLPFIYSENVAGLQLYYTFTALDINRQPLGTNDYTAFLLNEDSSYLLNQDGSKLIIARQNLVNQPIVEQVGVNRLLMNQDFGPDCYFIQAQLFYTGTGDVAIPVTNPVIVRIDTSVLLNVVYLRWIGLNGAWNYYRFNYSQTVTLDIQNPVIIKDYVSDWQNSEGIERVVSKDAGVKYQLYANLIDINDIDGLRSLKSSPMVQILSQNNPVKWKTIVVNSSTYTEYDTVNGQYDFGITYNLPSTNVQNQ